MPTCDICPRECLLDEGKYGFCGTRICRSGTVVSAIYGRSTGFAVDPIEKKPLNHFYPGSKVLSLGTVGCNFSCRFCQNWTTAQSRDFSLLQTEAAPEEIVAAAKQMDCRSVAFTYNEPVTWAEYAVDIAALCRKSGIKTVAVSNGFLSEKWRERFFCVMDAANIDLKSFSDDFYRTQCGGKLEPVKETLIYLANKPGFHLEITTLLIPTLNDSGAETEELSKWIFENLGPEIPLHFSAFYPAFQQTDLPPTSPQMLFRARETALSCGLQFVYTGNIDDPAGQSTYCPQCRQSVISRNRYQVEEYRIDEDSCCQYCGQTIAGVFE